MAELTPAEAALLAKLRPEIARLATEAALAALEVTRAGRLGPARLPGTVQSVDGEKATVLLDVDTDATKAITAKVDTKLPVQGTRVFVQFDDRGAAFVTGWAGGFA